MAARTQRKSGTRYQIRAHLRRSVPDQGTANRGRSPERAPRHVSSSRSSRILRCSLYQARSSPSGLQGLHVESFSTWWTGSLQGSGPAQSEHREGTSYETKALAPLSSFQLRSPSGYLASLFLSAFYDSYS